MSAREERFGRLSFPHEFLFCFYVCVCVFFLTSGSFLFPFELSHFGYCVYAVPCTQPTEWPLSHSPCGWFLLILLAWLISERPFSGRTGFNNTDCVVTVGVGLACKEAYPGKELMSPLTPLINLDVLPLFFLLTRCLFLPFLGVVQVMYLLVSFLFALKYTGRTTVMLSCCHEHMSRASLHA